jgi:hypothetical protein
MDDDTRYIGKSFFNIILDLMCDDVSLPDSLFPIDKEMELDDTVESTLADDTGIDIENGWIRSYDSPDSLLHIRIDDLIEQLPHSRPTDVIDVVAHKKGCDQGCPVSCRCKSGARKKCHNSTDESNPSRDSI